MPHRVDDQWILNKLIPYLVVKALLIWSNSFLPSFWIIALPLFYSPEIHSPLHHQWVLSKTENLALFFCLKTLQSLPRYTSWSLSIAAWTWGSLWSGSHPSIFLPVLSRQIPTTWNLYSSPNAQYCACLPALAEAPPDPWNALLLFYSFFRRCLSDSAFISSSDQSPLCSIFVSYLYFFIIYHTIHKYMYFLIWH